MGEADLFESAWEEIDRAGFEAKWMEEVIEAANQIDTETVRLATGLLLPIWSALPADSMAVNRITDDAGNSWLGRIVYDHNVAQLYTRLGIAKADELDPSVIAQAVMAGRVIDLTRPFPLTIKRSLVNGTQRLELVGAPASQLLWLKSIGCFTEIIAYRTRLFVPALSAKTIMKTLLA
jgi:hypothetical protein